MGITRTLGADIPDSLWPVREEGGMVVELGGLRSGADNAPSNNILTGLGFFSSAMRWRFNSSSIASETRSASSSAAIRRSRSSEVSSGGGAIARVRGSSIDVCCRLGAILEVLRGMVAGGIRDGVYPSTTVPIVLSLFVAASLFVNE